MADNSFSKLIQSIKEAADDLATLEVTTFTGTLTAEVAPHGKIDWSKLRQTAATGGGVTLVASTMVFPDHDVETYQTSLAVPGKEEMLVAHALTLKAAAEARVAFLRLVASSVGLAL